jgi:hypothetical protein
LLEQCLLCRGVFYQRARRRRGGNPSLQIELRAGKFLVGPYSTVRETPFAT